MQTYLVERYLPAAGSLGFDDLVRRARGGVEKAQARGAAVSYLGSMHSPEDEMCFCLYAAASPDEVQAANEEAGLRADRIVPAETSAP